MNEMMMKFDKNEWKSKKILDTKKLLGRSEIKTDLREAEKLISGKCVLVTGAGGSIGNELCRQLLKMKPRSLVMVDVYENDMYEAFYKWKFMCPEVEILPLIGSIRDLGRMETIVKKYSPQVIYHAAAHKHVPLMEDSPVEAIVNNVFGTYNMAYLADKYMVNKFLLISSDKAVNPTNIMGASKRICELVIEMFQQHSKTEYVAVRFGNVLGSKGSVIPILCQQIESGGPVTVTHPKVMRYFMTCEEAVSLVLKTSAMAIGGQIFILDMGQPINIGEMAKNLIRMYGLEPDQDIEVVYTGLRPGEKLFEELLIDKKTASATGDHLIYIEKTKSVDGKWLEEKLRELKETCNRQDHGVKELVREIIPEYQGEKKEDYMRWKGELYATV